MPVSVEELRAANQEIDRLVAEGLNDFFYSLNLSNPGQSKAEVLGTVPALTQEWGDVSAATAQEWYDETRAERKIARSFRARMANPVPEEIVIRRLRYGIGHLFTDAPEGLLPWLLDAMQEYVQQPGRDTITQSTARDPKAVGWRRVTSPGACDFCVMLAAKGVVRRKRSEAFKAHGNCSCVAAPEWVLG